MPPPPPPPPTKLTISVKRIASLAWFVTLFHFLKTLGGGGGRVFFVVQSMETRHNGTREIAFFIEA